MKINRLFGFFFNFIPGALHMYAGYMKQGMQLMGLFGIAIIGFALFESMNAGFFAILFVLPMIMIYIFSFFDGLRLMRNRMRSIEGEHEADVQLITFIRNTMKGPHWPLILKGAGGLFILVGLISFSRSVLNLILDNSFFNQFFYSISYNINNVVGSFVIFLIGYVVIRHAKNVRVVHVPDEKTEPFTEYRKEEYDDYNN